MRGLDGLRAIAVLAVVFFHATETWLRGGFLGVDVFFVLSGFLITGQLLVEWRQRGRIDIAAFWRRRARRILAALYALLAVTLTFALLRYPDEVAVFRGDAVAALAYVANWYFVFHHQPYFETVAHPSPLLHLWSLGVEEQFYVLWPLLLAPALALLRRWTALLILLAAIGSTALMAMMYLPGIDPSRIYYGTDTHAAGLLVGSLLAFYWSPGARRAGGGGDAPSFWARPLVVTRRCILPDAIGLAILAALAVFFVRANESQRLLYQGGFTLVALVTAAGVVAVSHPNAFLITALLEWGPVRWIGQRSYSIYLWHWPVIVFTRPGMDFPLSGISLLAARVAASLLLGELSYQLVEEPVRRGVLVDFWRRLEDAFWARRWVWLLGSWLMAAVVAGLVSLLGFAAAGAKAPAPPSYLAVTSVDTIVRPGVTPASAPAAATLPVSAPTPSPTTTAPESSAAATASLSVATDATLSTQPAGSGGTTATPAAAEAAPVPEAPSTPISAGRVIAIGDSVMLGAVPQLAQDIENVEVNASVSRQVVNGVQLLEQLRAAGALGQVVIVDLGSNGTFTSQEFEQIMGVLADVPRVVFVNVKVPRSWEAPNNAVITTGVQRYDSTRLVDWHGASAGHPEYFQVDQYHLRAEGAAAFAALIAAGVGGP